MTTIRIATRQSQLALWQANFIKSELERVHPDCVVELVGITTQGDKWLSAPLSEVGGKGLFIKELEAALLEDRADIAVHSVKDLPAEVPDGFDLPVIAYRAPVEDVLVSSQGTLAELKPGATVGSSSLRRQAQLLAQRPDLKVRSIRGNVDTRLGKLDEGEYDAIVLARAGLERLGIHQTRRDIHVLDVGTCLPAPGQGALGIECLADNKVLDKLAPLRDEVIAKCVTAERGVSKGLGADCSLPIAAMATMENDLITLEARLASADGSTILRSRKAGEEPEALASAVVTELMDQGGADVLAMLKADEHGNG